MDSINMIKGYGKVNALETQPEQLRPRESRRPLLAVSIASVLLLTIVIGALIAALVHQSVTEQDESSASWADSVKSVCSVTQYPESCFTSLTSANVVGKSDPESIFKLSLQISIRELSNSSLFVKHLRETSNDAHNKAALSDCESQIDDAMSQLNDSLAELERPGEKMLTDMKISNIQTWVSAAMTDEETCLDGLEEMVSPDLDEVKAKLQKSKEFMSNSLAIIAKMKDLLKKFDMGMH